MLQLLKQGRYTPLPVASQVAIIWAGSNGHLDDVAVNRVDAFEKEFLEFLDRSYKKTLAAIAKEKVLSPDIEAQLTKAVGEFKKMFTAE